MKKYKKLCELRKEHEYTLEMLAKKLGVTKQYLWDIEDGRRTLSYTMAYRISMIFGMTPDEIFLEDYREKEHKNH